jgi:hypothetical protein
VPPAAIDPPAPAAPLPPAAGSSLRRYPRLTPPAPPPPVRVERIAARPVRPGGLQRLAVGAGGRARPQVRLSVAGRD